MKLLMFILIGLIASGMVAITSFYEAALVLFAYSFGGAVMVIIPRDQP